MLLKVPVFNVVTQRVVAHSPGTHQHLDKYVAISPQPFSVLLAQGIFGLVRNGDLVWLTVTELPFID